MWTIELDGRGALDGNGIANIGGGNVPVISGGSSERGRELACVSDANSPKAGLACSIQI
jgi:hypothetical protein